MVMLPGMKIDSDLQNLFPSQVMRKMAASASFSEGEADREHKSFSNKIHVMLSPFFSTEKRGRFFSFLSTLNTPPPSSLTLSPSPSLSSSSSLFTVRYETAEDLEDPKAVRQIPALERRTLMTLIFDASDKAKYPGETLADDHNFL